MKMPLNRCGQALARPGGTLLISQLGRERAISIVEPTERILFWTYLAGLAWVPFWYGSNVLIAWGINAVVFPGLAILYEASLLVRRKPHPIGIKELALPAALFLTVVAWIGFQTITWSHFPLVNPIWGMAANALGRPVEGSISVDRDLTNLALIRLITTASVFWLALQLCRDGSRARLLIASVAAIGCGYAGYGLVAMKMGQLPWLDIPTTSGMVTSTFVNHNSFAAYAGICLVTAVGVVLQRYLREGYSKSGDWRYHVASLLEVSGTGAALPIAGGFVILAALLLTGSRGGIISTGMGLLVLGCFACRRAVGDGKPAIGAVIFVALLVLGTALAFGDTFVGNLEERGVTDANRLSVYLLTLRSIFDVPFLGYGYGTFVAVFPMYRDRSLSVDGVWGQAHDTYLEVLQGLGLVFGSMLIVCVVVLLLRCIRGARQRQENAIVPQVAASTAILVGVHILVDFSIQMQAVALTLMAVVGAGVAQSESSRAVLED